MIKNIFIIRISDSIDKYQFFKFKFSFFPSII